MISTLIRFSIGMLAGLFLVGLFTDNPQAASIGAVVCGVAVDKALKLNRSNKE
jgi:hypothetical protein